MEVTSNAKEFDTILLRAGEKGLYDGVRECEGIRYPPSSLETVVDKISVILQAKLAGLPLEDMLRNQGQLLSVNPRSDVSTILEHAPNMWEVATAVAKRSLTHIAVQLSCSSEHSHWKDGWRNSKICLWAVSTTTIMSTGKGLWYSATAYAA